MNKLSEVERLAKLIATAKDERLPGEDVQRLEATIAVERYWPLIEACVALRTELINLEECCTGEWVDLNISKTRSTP